MTRVLWLLFGLAAPAAYAEPWLCTEPDGRKEFNYDPQSARKPNCVDHPLSRGHVTPVKPRAEGYATPAEFPRINASTQKRRDHTRREILKRELEEEQE